MNAYDIIVIGAGPAGSMAAQAASMGNAKVWPIGKKRKQPGLLSGAEKVSGLKALLSNQFEIDPKWVKPEFPGSGWFPQTGPRLPLNNSVDSLCG